MYPIKLIFLIMCQNQYSIIVSKRSVKTAKFDLTSIISLQTLHSELIFYPAKRFFK